MKLIPRFFLFLSVYSFNHSYDHIKLSSLFVYLADAVLLHPDNQPQFNKQIRHISGVSLNIDDINNPNAKVYAFRNPWLNLR